jgi:GT2 family glycosyltransferase
LRVSAVIVNYKQPQLTVDCVRSLLVALERVRGGTEVVVVDNGSGDGSVHAIATAIGQSVKVIAATTNLGFAKGVNTGVGASSGEWLLLLNNDTTVQPNAVVRLLEAGDSRQSIGAVAAEMRFASQPDCVNSAGIGVDRLGVAFDRGIGEHADGGTSAVTEVFGASGGAALIRRTMFAALGGLDEAFFLYMEDADLAWRARANGWECVYAPGAVVHHQHSATSQQGSPLKYFYVGRNRVWLLAKNATWRQLLRYGAAMVAYDVAYVVYAATRERTLAPLHGRLVGLCSWRRMRRTVNRRATVTLDPVEGVRKALVRRRGTSAHRARKERSSA